VSARARVGDILLDRIIAMAKSDATDERSRAYAIGCLGNQKKKPARVVDAILAGLSGKSGRHNLFALHGLDSSISAVHFDRVADALTKAVDNRRLPVSLAARHIGLYGGEAHTAWLTRWLGDRASDRDRRNDGESVRRALEAIRARQREHKAGDPD